MKAKPILRKHWGFPRLFTQPAAYIDIFVFFWQVHPAITSGASQPFNNFAEACDRIKEEFNILQAQNHRWERYIIF